MPGIDETRKLVQFDLTAEDIPPLAGFDWATDIPFAASMARENLRVVAKRHPGQFQEVLLLACRMMARANPDKWIEITDREYDDDGMMCGCTVAAIVPGIEDGPDNLIWFGGNSEDGIMIGPRPDYVPVDLFLAIRNHAMRVGGEVQETHVIFLSASEARGLAVRLLAVAGE